MITISLTPITDRITSVTQHFGQNIPVQSKSWIESSIYDTTIHLVTRCFFFSWLIQWYTPVDTFYISAIWPHKSGQTFHLQALLVFSPEPQEMRYELNSYMQPHFIIEKILCSWVLSIYKVLYIFAMRYVFYLIHWLLKLLRWVVNYCYWLCGVDSPVCV